MRKSDIKLLIVDDDSTTGRALCEVMNRAGFTCQWAKSATEALNYLKFQGFHLAIIDCVLPQMNGVDLCQRIQNQLPRPLPVIFISGIFKDPNFATDVKAKTKAVAFLHKPIHSQELLEIIHEQMGDLIEASGDLSELTMTKVHVTAEDSLEMLQRTGTVHGYQIPQVISLLLNSDLTGSLNLIERNGEISSITFFRGNITYVNKSHAKSFFGALLIEKGFSSADEVKAGLEMNSTKPLGERLVEKGVLSPHMIDLVRAEQMQIRLSLIVQDTAYDINFLPEQIAPSEVQIQLENLPNLLRDWCWSKIDPEWIKTFFRPFMELTLQFQDRNEIRLLTQALNLESHGLRDQDLLKDDQTLRELLNQFENIEPLVLRTLYFFTVQKYILFKASPSKQTNYDEHFQRLERLYNDIKEQGPFEVLGVSHQARSKEINKAYIEMAKVLHPDKWGPDAPTALRELSQNIFSIITTAHDKIKDDQKRQAYLKSIEIGLVDEALRAETDLQTVHQMLQRGKVKDAIELLKQIPKNKMHDAQIRLFTCWARAKRAQGSPLGLQLAAEINEELRFIAPEDRHSPLYFFVRGLMHRLADRHDRALINFQRAVLLENDFNEAKKELHLAKEKIRTQSKLGILNSVVTKLFGRRKAG